MKRALLIIATFALSACEGNNCFISCGDQSTGPSPIATPSPTPTPAPTTFPTPSPAATPTSLCELLGPPATPPKCVADQSAGLSFRVQLAADTLAKTPPALPYTEQTYVAALALALKAQGLCVVAGVAGGVTSDEVAVKLTNAYSETFDVWNAGNFPQVLYQQTCTPSRF